MTERKPMLVERILFDAPIAVLADEEVSFRILNDKELEVSITYIETGQVVRGTVGYKLQEVCRD